MATQPLDRWNRPAGSLRVSVTDRCNIRCQYCMPEEHYTWLPRKSIMTFEEIERVVRAFAAIGVDRVRFTGGEPLMRHGLASLIARINGLGGIKETAMTTNGVMLDALVPDLRQAGLSRVTVSLDTLDRARYEEFTRMDRLDRVMASIEALKAAGFRRTKLNTVVIRGFNEDEIPALVEFAHMNNAEPRFIEYMDVGGATDWNADMVVPRTEIIERLSSHFGAVQPDNEIRGSAPAERYLLPDGRTVGIVASTTTPFCHGCDRARITADGHLFLCLYADEGVDLKTMLRSGISDEELVLELSRIWRARADRGAMDRLGERERGALYPVESLREHPHREMHTRGG